MREEMEALTRLKDPVTADEMEPFNMMLQFAGMIHPEKMQRLLPYVSPGKVALVHEEVKRAEWWPLLGVDSAAVLKDLRQLAMSCQNLPGGMLVGWKGMASSGGDDTDTSPLFSDVAYLAKRSHLNGGPPLEAWVKWFCDCHKFGDVWSGRHAFGITYSGAFVRQMFTNAPHPVQPLAAGGTTVSVGFVDLSVIGFSGLSTNVKANLPKDDLQHHFVLIDATAAHVATSMALWQMASSGCSVSNLAEAWYSSVWSTDTEKLFQIAAKELLAADVASVPREVRTFLDLWASASSIPVEKAHSNWLRFRRLSEYDEAMQLAKLQDRLALLRYVLTGRLFVDCMPTEKCVGSLAMFVVPKGAPPLDCTTALHGIPMEKFSKALKAHSKMTVIQVAEEVLRGGAARILELAKKSAKVRVDFVFAELKLTEKALVKRLRGLRPESVMWSNILDYIAPQDFHKLSSAVAESDCLHMGYTMNWHADVFGANLLDHYEEHYIKNVDVLVKQAIESNTLFYKLYELMDRFVVPAPINPINLTQGFFAVACGRRWVTDYFMKASTTLVQCEGEDMIFPSVANWPFARAQGCMSFIWTYDPEMTFKPSPFI